MKFGTGIVDKIPHYYARSTLTDLLVYGVKDTSITKYL